MCSRSNATYRLSESPGNSTDLCATHNKRPWCERQGCHPHLQAAGASPCFFFRVVESLDRWHPDPEREQEEGVG